MPVLKRTTFWVCPNCSKTDTTFEYRPHSRMHSCTGLLGITAPFVEQGVKCEVVALEREDYVGNEQVQLNGAGRPIMSVITRYGDGRQDVAVMAPTATWRSEAYL